MGGIWISETSKGLLWHRETWREGEPSGPAVSSQEGVGEGAYSVGPWAGHGAGPPIGWGLGTTLWPGGPGRSWWVFLPVGG